MSVLSTTHGKGRIEIRQRSVPPRLVPKSAAVALLSLFVVVIVTLILLLSEGTDLLTALFETVSAFATVGLSVGLTPKLSILGRLVIAALMFAGRIGPLTLAVAIAQRQEMNHVEYPEEQLVVG